MLNFTKEEEKLDPDPCFGKRIHAWVLLMLPPKPTVKTDPEDDTQEQAQPIFIEPSTGFVIANDDPNYFAIEAVWNQHNYYVRIFVSVFVFYIYHEMGVCEFR